ncbi:MAG TPA: 8-amino-7-oxononanoate synthase [Nitrospiria bacterium]|nr:8-amino-7-oxononanoate synthase [Nitrospiria bacterium]
MDFHFHQDAIERLHANGLFRCLRRVEPDPHGHPGRVMIEGRSVILLSSNNYLGLADHPRIKEAAITAIRQYGFGSGASRLISGNAPPHEALEERIAQFKQTESALVFSTGYMANLGVLSCLIPSQGLLIADRLCHASLIDGCRMSGCRFRVFEHGDLDQLERMLAKRPADQPTLIVTDGVFSMDGDIAPLPNLVELAERHGAAVFVDDAHATGVIGKEGRGTLEHFGLKPGRVFQMGTLGKALGGFGAYVAGSRVLIDYLINKAKTFIYTTALPPASAAAALAAFDLLREEPERRERLWQNRAYYADGLKSLGFDLLNSETPIIPIMIGDDRSAMTVSQRLLEAGVFAPAIRPPTVPKGTSRIRTTIMASHTREDLDRVLDSLGRIARSLRIL